MPRKTVPLFLSMPPDERDRLKDFSSKTGRPMGWIVRDAVRVYVETAERDAETMARVRVRLDAPKLAPAKVGLTKQAKRGPRAVVRMVNVR